MIVTNNSALVESLVGDAPSQELRSLVAEEQLHVPALLDYEFGNALRGLFLGQKISRARVEGARLVKSALPLTRYLDEVTGSRAWDLRSNFNVYDATYVALSEVLDAVLVTTDDKIAKTIRTVQVDLY